MVENSNRLEKGNKQAARIFDKLIAQKDNKYTYENNLGKTIEITVLENIDRNSPEYEEQKNIADYLDSKTAHIDRIVETIHNQIEQLQELRKTLITAVVTGKIKVIEN